MYTITMKLVNMFSSLVLRVYTHYCANTLEKVGKTIFTSFVVVVYTVFLLLYYFIKKMSQLSWKKASAAVGLAGLTPREVVRGVLTQLEFQLMPDPLNLDPFGKLIVKGEVSGVPLNYFYSLFYVEHVRQISV